MSLGCAGCAFSPGGCAVCAPLQREPPRAIAKAGAKAPAKKISRPAKGKAKAKAAAAVLDAACSELPPDADAPEVPCSRHTCESALVGQQIGWVCNAAETWRCVHTTPGRTRPPSGSDSKDSEKVRMGDAQEFCRHKCAVRWMRSRWSGRSVMAMIRLSTADRSSEFDSSSGRLQWVPRGKLEVSRCHSGHVCAHRTRTRAQEEVVP